MEGAKWLEIRSDRQKGMSFAEIARKYHLDPRTAKKYALSETTGVQADRAQAIETGPVQAADKCVVRRSAI